MGSACSYDKIAKWRTRFRPVCTRTPAGNQMGKTPWFANRTPETTVGPHHLPCCCFSHTRAGGGLDHAVADDKSSRHAGMYHPLTVRKSETGSVSHRVHFSVDHRTSHDPNTAAIALVPPRPIPDHLWQAPLASAPLHDHQSGHTQAKYP